ncbi:MAG: ArsI/CadI family heavy metal resistance metalloenzyme [Acidimicrobiales bacterium]
MSRLQLGMNVENLDAAVDYYSKLFDTTPAKREPGYANFAIANPPLKLVLFENAGDHGTINHLGIEHENADAVHSELDRVREAGLEVHSEGEDHCCYAFKDEGWIDGADGHRWEIYTVLADAPTAGHLDGPEVCCAEPEPALAGTATDSGSSCC